ncbi:IclR family transcriptional regulator [Streptomyces mirabilis]|uniref:hypothetical protein n=1 Tax=Streptomyces mirabilis TaxID=68239 RepID=UPI0036B18BBB
MLKLSVRTRAAVLLAIMNAGDLLFLEILSGQVRIASLPRPGDRVPPGSSGMSLVLRASQDPSDSAAQHVGHAVVEGRLAQGVTEVVAAVRCSEAQGIAALGVAGHLERAQLPGVIHVVMEAANALSHDLMQTLPSLGNLAKH